MRSKHKSEETPEPLVLSHLSGIQRALLEGEKRPAFLEFLRQTDDRRGLYARNFRNLKVPGQSLT